MNLHGHSLATQNSWMVSPVDEILDIKLSIFHVLSSNRRWADAASTPRYETHQLSRVIRDLGAEVTQYWAHKTYILLGRYPPRLLYTRSAEMAT